MLEFCLKRIIGILVSSQLFGPSTCAFCVINRLVHETLFFCPVPSNGNVPLHYPISSHGIPTKLAK